MLQMLQSATRAIQRLTLKRRPPAESAPADAAGLDAVTLSDGTALPTFTEARRLQLVALRQAVEAPSPALGKKALARLLHSKKGEHDTAAMLLQGMPYPSAGVVSGDAQAVRNWAWSSNVVKLHTLRAEPLGALEELEAEMRAGTRHVPVSKLSAEISRRTGARLELLEEPLTPGWRRVLDLEAALRVASERHGALALRFMAVVLAGCQLGDVDLTGRAGAADADAVGASVSGDGCAEVASAAGWAYDGRLCINVSSVMGSCARGGETRAASPDGTECLMVTSRALDVVLRLLMAALAHSRMPVISILPMSKVPCAVAAELARLTTGANCSAGLGLAAQLTVDGRAERAIGRCRAIDAQRLRLPEGEYVDHPRNFAGARALPCFYNHVTQVAIAGGDLEVAAKAWRLLHGRTARGGDVAGVGAGGSAEGGGCCSGCAADGGAGVGLERL